MQHPKSASWACKMDVKMDVVSFSAVRVDPKSDEYTEEIKKGIKMLNNCMS